MQHHCCDTLVIGAGIVGIATAYFLKKHHPKLAVVLVDAGQPMALTSAQSGENYRNWWPHPVMTAFTDHSIDLMEKIAWETNNCLHMTRRGYALATRSCDIDLLIQELIAGYGSSGTDSIRVHDQPSASCYQASTSEHWQSAPSGVDVLKTPDLIRTNFPSYDPGVQAIVHIRRAGAISGQQMGQHMLEQFKAAGGKRFIGRVGSIATGNSFRVELTQPDARVLADRVVNAAGPFINEIAAFMGTRLPVKNSLQQKIAFEDYAAVIPRDMPFSIDLDAQCIDWDVAESELLASDPDFHWLSQEMPGAIHCRPDGGEHGTWIKLGWAFNRDVAEPAAEPQLSATFPEIVLRGAARLNPGLKAYYERLPRGLHHYGGYYTMTDENWPLIGKMDIEGAYVVGALSGFGTMAACAAGDLGARWILDGELPEYAHALCPDRYRNDELMAQLDALASQGIL